MLYTKLSKKKLDYFSPEEKWRQMSSNEREILSWLVMLPCLERKTVDGAGSALHGPYKYYQSLCRLMQSECVFLLRMDGMEYYCIPREMDHYIIKQITSEVDPAGSPVYFDITSFLFYFLLYLNQRLQMETEKACNDEDLVFKEFDSIFSDELKEIIRDPGRLIHYFRYAPDNVAEHFAVLYLHKKTAKENVNVKHLLYGYEIAPSFLNIGGEITELPFFTAAMPSVTLNKMEDYYDRTAKGIPLHNNEWLFPINADPSFLLTLLSFSHLVSTGQMLHLQFTEESIKRGKEKFTDHTPFWNEILRNFSNDSASLGELESLAEKDAPVINKGSFVYYYISSPSMRPVLVKKAIAHAGTEFVVRAEEGVLIAADKVSVWEQYLKQENISLTYENTEVSEQKELEYPFSTGNHEEVQLKEWKEARRIPEAAFKLMSCRENMKARMIRQSQALKLPVIIELNDGLRIVEEVKTLSYQTAEARIETYSGKNLSLSHIKRIALGLPGSEESM